MQIKDMFLKPVDREIQGVIIVGQGEETNVSQELEEYVVTRELQKHFADFFEAYKKGIVGNTNEVGVWISGFFGSGKSHFLKILSYILANKEVNGKRAIDYFVEDNKITDAMVLADMKLAAETPTDVVLFNIDSKSDSNSKQNKDAIVNVFLKVFNEMQGFCGSLPHLADLESQLTDAGKYDAFKAAFEDEYGSEWEESRHKFDFIQDDVVEALAKIDFMSEEASRNWCEKATESYRISIEDFAKRVKEYINKKGNNHHVVFMVDEVGQYIGDDSSLMLNLQTVREELSKECKGKAWVIVTSQQDVDSIMKVKGNDFSKIQGRFNPRLSLSSANVDEVIKKRILEKNETGAQTLRLLYEQKATIIKNLIVFNDGVEKKLYFDENDFAGVYPFVPYQFNLLASVLTSMAELNLKQIIDRLNTEFTGENRKLVFWYDDKAEFEEDMKTVELQNAKIYLLQKDNQFYTKYFLERLDTETNYLIYAPFPKPEVKDNHLEDTMLYSKRFFADRASLLSVDLGIEEKYKPIIEKHIKFFGNKDRTQRFYDLEIENFNEENILVGLLSAICKTRTCSFEEVLRIVLTESDIEENIFLEEFAKYDLYDSFWKLCEQQFGYRDDSPSLERLLVTMFVTYTDRYLQGNVPKPWSSFVSLKQGNIIAFLDNLMNSVLYREDYDVLSDHVAEGLHRIFLWS